MRTPCVSLTCVSFTDVLKRFRCRRHPSTLCFSVPLASVSASLDSGPVKHCVRITKPLARMASETTVRLSLLFAILVSRFLPSFNFPIHLPVMRCAGSDPRHLRFGATHFVVRNFPAPLPFTDTLLLLFTDGYIWDAC